MQRLPHSGPIARSLTVAASSAFLAGCPPAPYKYTLYNNSGVEVEVSQQPKNVFITRGAAKKVIALGVKFIKVGDGRVWCYDSSSLPISAWDPLLETAEGGSLSKHFTLQLESDGKIYVLSNLSALPSTALTLQPSGFPLSPSERTCT